MRMKQDPELTPEEETFLDEEIGNMLHEGEIDEIAADLGIANRGSDLTDDEAWAIVTEADERHRDGLAEWVISLRPPD